MFVNSPGEEYFELITACPYSLWGVSQDIVMETIHLVPIL